jgi:hypothetical protein
MNEIISRTYPRYEREVDREGGSEGSERFRGVRGTKTFGPIAREEDLI